MKPLAIDFSRTTNLSAHNQWQRKHPLLRLTWLLAALALILALGQLWQSQQRSHALDQALQAKMQAAFFHSDKATPSTPKLPPAQIKAINDAVHQLNLPWVDWFAAFEQATQPGVSLLSIVPNAQSRAVNASAECDDVQTMLTYIEALRASRFFTDVQLRKHRSDESAVDGRVQFDFVAQVAQP
ncbi:hypothetical protein [Chitinimonas sp. BJB300]|uniref:hypothetical protein n=1 Tax=Chitinimonas sp. BJB300 TaxID=1559339 RepID=UPI000C0EC1EE|nr:hypothetical protein [Chitinimonas sp. BJB300]PHV11009.1 hypothetical protein CSQ89_13180 [Chitinimonas sp. BJB300]TSJ87012.1 hypothetical protein FG002_015650 [Chitinimonas sp. BJB300]